MLKKLRVMWILSLLLTATVALSARSAQEPSSPPAEDVQASAVVLSASEGTEVIDVQFQLKVTNGDAAGASNVFVTFPDGLQVSLGDIAANAFATSAKQTYTVNLVDTPSRSIPVRVKLTFGRNGSSVERTQMLILHLPVDGASR